MEDLTLAPSAPVAAPAATPAQPSFADAFAAAQSGTPQPEPAAKPATPTPAVASATAPATPAVGTESTAPATTSVEAPPAIEWGQLGESVKGFDDVKRELDSLRANQLTDAQRAVLRMADDPAGFREYAELVNTDFTALSDEDALLRDYQASRPGMDAEDAAALFDEELAQKYPGLQDEPDSRRYKATLAALKHDADAVRQKHTLTREQRLTELRQAALAPSGPSEQEVQQNLDAHLSAVAKLLEGGADAFKQTVDVKGKPLHLAVDAADLPALKAALEAPFADFANEDGSINYEEVKQAKAWKLMGPKWLALAYQAGQEGQGPVVSVDELHNPSGGAPVNPAAQPSFSQAFAAAGGNGSSGGGGQKKSIYER